MNLNDFISLKLNDDAKSVPSHLILPPYLQAAIQATKASSETDTLEKGHCLSWNDRLRQITVQMPVFVGSYDGLGLDLPINRQRHDYIGNYHNHPYEKRYGVDYALGPSSTDWEEWGRCFPEHKNISINIVTSGKLVFLSLFLQQPPAKARPKLSDTATAAEAKETYIYNGTKAHSDTYNHVIEHKTWDREINLYKDIKKTSGVDIPMLHQQDVLAMNEDFVKETPCIAFYIGPLAGNICKLNIFARHPGLPLLDQIQAIPKVVCFSCKEERTHNNHSYFAKWHKCPRCQRVYCPGHGKVLAGNHLFSRERNCVVCNARTHLF